MHVPRSVQRGVHTTCTYQGLFRGTKVSMVPRLHAGLSVRMTEMYRSTLSRIIAPSSFPC